MVNQTPDVIPTDDLHVAVQNEKSGQYFQVSEYHKGDAIILQLGARMSNTPQTNDSTPTPWFSHEETYQTNIIIYRGDKVIGTMKARMTTTKINNNKLTKLISHTGFKSVELDLSPQEKDASDEYWYYTTLNVKL